MAVGITAMIFTKGFPMVEMRAVAPGLGGLGVLQPHPQLALRGHSRCSLLLHSQVLPDRGSSHLFSETTEGQLNERILLGHVAPKEIWPWERAFPEGLQEVGRHQEQHSPLPHFLTPS